jgi:A/G-specific adenine glycosylase
MASTQSEQLPGYVANQAEIQQALLVWFSAHRRDLPWRRTRDPYRILVSEVMLQQTQVDRVVPKYTAFLEAFPTLETLAAAPTADVIRAWAGLGYNRRAVHLQRTARAVVEQYSGEFPRDVAALRRLPGIGPYTAGALACFAFEQDVAFMDTNIRRVVRRLVLSQEVGVDTGEAQLLKLAAQLIPASEGWAWNQALMELGALICTAAAPACWRCPVRAWCQDYAARRATDEQWFDPPVAARPVRRIAERREAPYTGSSRFYRGRIIDALRSLPPGAVLRVEDLGRQLKSDFGHDDVPWLHTLIAGLARDGLIVAEGPNVGLPH